MNRLLGIVFLFLLISCGNKEEQGEPVTSNKSGEELAKVYCASCHAFPKPEMLPRNIWLKKVLPNMALRTGNGDLMKELLSLSDEDRMYMLQAGFYPQKPMMTKEDWDKIVKYYELESLESIDSTFDQPEVTGGLPYFKTEQQAIDSKNIVMAQWDDKEQKFYVSTSNRLFSIDKNKEAKEEISETKSPIVKYRHHKDYGKVLLEIGHLNPKDLPLGALKVKDTGEVLLDKMARPVDFLIEDINQDGVDDFLVANFGYHLGDLSWYDGRDFKQHILSNEPGARKLYYVDLDRDGKKDIVSLMTQGKEQVVLYKNLGKGRYKEKVLLSFPPYHGSSYFVLKDMDADGDLDIVYTNGDNADLSIVFKYYHGVHIYTNTKGNFKETYFYAINGASKVCVEDFNKDSNLDLAVISYFPKATESEGFLYFEGTDEHGFQVYSEPTLSKEKWLTIDTGDLDNDGYKEIILGGFDRGVEKKKMVYLLKNTSKP
ncbi:FG-GAP-like repeat-containing protein [uncultured Arcticibacterium sp.]|uniref:FG-GAP repeat domain-containing protein n=1 Tax=uncultured Arcticibacterium sp. TaxID=2173042 RepID=UPI0030F8EC13